jgi:hypothetical protein
VSASSPIVHDSGHDQEAAIEPKGRVGASTARGPILPWRPVSCKRLSGAAVLSMAGPYVRDRTDDQLFRDYRFRVMRRLDSWSPSAAALTHLPGSWNAMPQHSGRL